jgi:hypothetical protein
MQGGRDGEEETHGYQRYHNLPQTHSNPIPIQSDHAIAQQHNPFDMFFSPTLCPDKGKGKEIAAIIIIR